MQQGQLEGLFGGGTRLQQVHKEISDADNKRKNSVCHRVCMHMRE